MLSLFVVFLKFLKSQKTSFGGDLSFIHSHPLMSLDLGYYSPFPNKTRPFFTIILTLHFLLILDGEKYIVTSKTLYVQVYSGPFLSFVGVDLFHQNKTKQKRKKLLCSVVDSSERFRGCV